MTTIPHRCTRYDKVDEQPVRCTAHATHQVAFKGVISAVAGTLCDSHAKLIQAEYDALAPEIGLQVIPLHPTRLGFVDRSDPEFLALWATFERLTPYRADFKDPQTGEVWQYMGCALLGETWWHEFRHRSMHGQRRVVSVRASEGWEPAKTMEAAHA